jgi:endo-1,4-beta-xylanase
VWPAWSYSPSDINASQTHTYIKNRIRGHLNAILKYPGVGTDCIDWDVLNEISDNNQFANHFAGKPGYPTGRELYSEIFKQADSLAPNVKLYINDYVAIEQGGTGGVNRYKSRIDELLAAGAPVEGIGFQGHFSTSPTGIPRVKEIYDEFWNKYKLEAKVTEYDIAKLTSPDIQANYMRDILSITFAHPSMKGFLMWGFWDGSHWLDNSPIYNKDWSLKPSGTAFIDQVFTKWWTDTKQNTATNGEAQNRCFKGKYKITIKLPNGKILTQNIDLDKDKTLTINTNGSVGTQDLAVDFGLKVSPNPTTDSIIHITWNPSFSADSGQIQIINSAGASVFEKNINMNQGSFDLTDFQGGSGVYFVVLKTNKGKCIEKIIVN